ncbi:hypothetical protein [Blastopirellula retiformator]|uniref:Uncharacterized protein n=1 Tax=Blastopirellula retiformator TaxID=2527970 RepID=A0A5C5V293_9BACT|nr:hypothetical protein [Blastopirellula retiformator]TWT31842.1 hypothetical protein Enr8_37670 [Blastopirellula retiformator]
MSREKWWNLTPLQIVHWLLLLVTMWGLFGVWETQHALRNLTAERNRLAEIYGDLRAADADNFQITKLPSAEPREFRWRFDQPPGKVAQIRTSIHGLDGRWSTQQSSYSSSHPLGFHRIKYLEAGNDAFLFVTNLQGTRHWEISDSIVGELLRDHWDELDIQVGGSPTSVEFNDDQVVAMIQITAPLSLLREMNAEGYESDFQFFSIQLGTDLAFEKLETTSSQPGVP